MNVIPESQSLLQAVTDILEKIDPQAPQTILDRIQSARALFIAGAGRTGYIARAFAMRLMHLGFLVHIVGETTSPAPTEKDLLIAFSGSGETLSTCEVEARALARDVPTLAITANPESRLAQEAHDMVVLPVGPNDFPLGTLFEACLYVFLDSCILSFQRILTVSDQDMSRRHA